MVERILSGFRRMMSDDAGVSFGRFAALLSLVAVISWDSAYIFLAWMFNTRYLKPGMALLPLLPDPLILGAQAAFMSTFYVATKVAEVRKAANAANSGGTQ